MVRPTDFLQVLKENDLQPLIGVPCSVLAPLINYALDNPEEIECLNPVNEAHALGLACGVYMGSGKIPVVFLQNSGLGNLVNPLTSLSQTYRLPAFLLVTWRGASGPGTDAPEHDIMGRDLEAYLRVLHIPYGILSESRYAEQIARLRQTAEADEIPVAAVVAHRFFDSYESHTLSHVGRQPLNTHEAIRIIKETLVSYTFLSTTGFISRESFDIARTPDFYMLGSMGLVPAVGCGIALTQPEKRVAILDGDGAVLMHLGLLPFIGSRKPRKLLHFILDNEVYASTGNQPTVSPLVRFDEVAIASGYRNACCVSTGDELLSALEEMKEAEGPSLVWVKVASGRGENLGRVSFSPEEIKKRFIQSLWGGC
jgi:phosphonopyruvate decarboxylase